MRSRTGLLLVLVLALAACAPVPPRVGIAQHWLPSPNHDDRRPNFVVLHHTGSSSAAHALETLTTPARAVSAHYLVARDGTIWQLVDERARAWHAGDSYWGGSSDLNSSSLGIELDNDGDEPFADAQIEALFALLADVTARHRIPAANVLGHGDVAPGRKVDPSRHFPWQRLAEKGFGLWCDAPGLSPSALATANTPGESPPPVPAPSSAPSTGEAEDQPPQSPAPATTDAAVLLQALGYDVRNVDAATAAFRRHFRQDDAPRLAEGDIELLQCLVANKAARRTE